MFFFSDAGRHIHSRSSLLLFLLFFCVFFFSLSLFLCFCVWPLFCRQLLCVVAACTTTEILKWPQIIHSVQYDDQLIKYTKKTEPKQKQKKFHIFPFFCVVVIVFGRYWLSINFCQVAVLSLLQWQAQFFGRGSRQFEIDVALVYLQQEMVVPCMRILTYTHSLLIFPGSVSPSKSIFKWPPGLFLQKMKITLSDILK